MSHDSVTKRALAYLKYKKPETNEQRKATRQVAIACFLLIATLFGPTLLPRTTDWIMIQGRSMWPTVKWMSHWPFVSGYVHIDRDRVPIRGELVVFRVDGRWWREQCKRVDQVRGQEPNLEFWLSADNSGVTGEGSDLSDQYDWVPFAHIVGVVDQIWSPEQSERAQSSSGRLHNLLALKYDPSWVVYNDGANYAVYVPGDSYTSINGEKTYAVMPSGGEIGNPLLVDFAYKRVFRVRGSSLIRAHVTQTDAFQVSRPVISEVASETVGGWRVSGSHLPIFNNPLRYISDGDSGTGWFAPAGLEATLTVDFGRPATREVVVKHQGRGMGDVRFETSVDGLTWKQLSPDLRGCFPGNAVVARQLGRISCRFLRISNIMGSAWTIYEVEAK